MPSKRLSLNLTKRLKLKRNFILKRDRSIFNESDLHDYFKQWCIDNGFEFIPKRLRDANLPDFIVIKKGRIFNFELKHLQNKTQIYTVLGQGLFYSRKSSKTTYLVFSSEHPHLDKANILDLEKIIDKFNLPLGIVLRLPPFFIFKELEGSPLSKVLGIV